jgi:hypothetical protein
MPYPDYTWQVYVQFLKATYRYLSPTSSFLRKVLERVSPQTAGGQEALVALRRASAEEKSHERWVEADLKSLEMASPAPAPTRKEPKAKK